MRVGSCSICLFFLMTNLYIYLIHSSMQGTFSWYILPTCIFSLPRHHLTRTLFYSINHKMPFICVLHLSRINMHQNINNIMAELRYCFHYLIQSLRYILEMVVSDILQIGIVLSMYTLLIFSQWTRNPQKALFFFV